MHFDIDEIINRFSKVWLNHINLGQDEIASDIGISPYTLRKFIKKEATPKIKTQIKIMGWLNAMEGKVNTQ